MSITPQTPKKSRENDIEIVRNEKNDFYCKFMVQKLLKQVEILYTENIEETFQKTYTVYIIFVKTNLLEFSIQKRFSEFFSLAQKVIDKKHKEISPFLNNFPGKKFFRNLDPELIETRKNQLNEFLKFLLIKYEEYFCFEFLEFLEIKEKFEKDKISFVELITDSKISSKITSFDEKELAKSLEKLNTSKGNLAFHFSEIEGIFTRNTPILSREFIKLLLFGEGRLKGLIQFCGKNEPTDSHIICASGLRLLYKLMDYEFNKDAETFLKVFSNGSPSVLSNLQLSYHFPFQNQKPCSLFAFRLLDFYLNRNPSMKKELILTLLCDNTGDSYDEYEKWKEHQKFFSPKTENYDGYEKGSPYLHEKRKIKHEEKNEIHEEERKVSLDLLSDEITLRGFLRMKSPKMWQTVEKNQQKRIKIQHFQGVYIKTTINIEKESEEVYNKLKQKSSIFMKSLEDFQIIEDRGENGYISYEKVQWNTSKTLKHLIFISEVKLEKILGEKNEYFIYKRSKNEEIYKALVPLNKSDHLSQSLFCMRIVGCKNQKGCKLKLIFKNFNQDSVLFFSTDLLGETKVLFTNLLYLKEFCEK